MWISIPGGQEVTLSRSLPLSAWEGALLQPYGDALADLEGVPDAVARTAADDVVLRAIASQLGGVHASAVESAIRFLFRCAVATYEGQPLHLNVLFDSSLPAGSSVVPSLDELRVYDWHALIGSGLETGILLDGGGGVAGVVDVRGGTPSPTTDAFRPDVFRHVGDWTSSPGRVALSLARSRELLLHQSGELRYIYRAGAWRGLPLDVALRTGWTNGASISRDVKRAVLASAIDSSLGHHGACLAVVARGSKLTFLNSTTLQQADLWPGNVRSELFPSQTFSGLTRRQRLELLSMDGATVLDHQGEILAAGAIVAVPGGSSGGGRLAATRALAAFGTAIKISQDGPIQLFGRGTAGGVEQKMAIA